MVNRYDLLEALFRRILDTGGVLYKRISTHPDVDNMVDVLVNSSSLERFFTDGLTAHGLDATRVTLLAKILGDSVYKNKEVTAEMFSVVMDDCDKLRYFIDGRVDDMMVSAGYVFAMDAGSVEQIFRNLSTGTARGSARVFKQYAHNNHLLRQALVSPDLFIGDALTSLEKQIPSSVGLHMVVEAISDDVSKISDLEIRLQIEHLQLVKNDGSIEKVLDTGDEVLIPITFDSKVFQDGISGVMGAFEQQFELFFGGRVRLVLLPILDDLDRLSGRFTADEKRAFLESVIPGLFRHYVFVPADFPADTSSLSAYYARKMQEQVPMMLDVQMSEEHPDYDLVLEILLEHTDDHFGGGKFINRNSEMNFEWATTVPASDE
jgi:hypothetical protein